MSTAALTLEAGLEAVLDVVESVVGEAFGLADRVARSSRRGVRRRRDSVRRGDLTGVADARACRADRSGRPGSRAPASSRPSTYWPTRGGGWSGSCSATGRRAPGASTPIPAGRTSTTTAPALVRRTPDDRAPPHHRAVVDYLCTDDYTLTFTVPVLAGNASSAWPAPMSGSSPREGRPAVPPGHPPYRCHRQQSGPGSCSATAPATSAGRCSAPPYAVVPDRRPSTCLGGPQLGR